jgi:hypothetical protein
MLHVITKHKLGTEACFVFLPYIDDTLTLYAVDLNGVWKTGLSSFDIAQ